MATENNIMKNLKTTVSHSELEAFTLCERRHYYQYGLRLGSIAPSIALTRGNFGHAALEQLFNYRMENPNDIAGSYTHAINWIAEQFTNDMSVLEYSNDVVKAILGFQNKGGLEAFEPLAVELRLEAPIADNIDMSLIIDLVVRDADGKIGVIDHKFLSRAYYGDQTTYMPQLPRYILAIQNLEEYPNPDWVAYSEFLWKSGEWTFQVVDVTPEQLAQTSHEFREAARRILERRFDVAVNENDGLYKWSQQALRTFNTMVCDRCPVKKICAAELTGKEVQWTLDTFYRVRERKEATEENGSEPTE